MTSIPRVGDPAPDLVLPTLAGGEVSTEMLRGRRIIQFFWASW